MIDSALLKTTPVLSYNQNINTEDFVGSPVSLFLTTFRNLCVTITHSPVDTRSAFAHPGEKGLLVRPGS